MKRLAILLALSCPLLVMAQADLRLKDPPASAALFANGFISTGQRERDMALSPDGTELFYTIQSPLGLFQTILHALKDGSGKWSKPEVASFAGKFSDLEPAFSFDGKKLFFCSNRPLAGDSIKDFDIWFVEKKNNTWGVPQNVGEPVNTLADEYYPSIAKNGNLYYTAAYKNGVGKEDIYKATWENGRYTNVAPLDTAVNSLFYDFNAYVSPEETLILFTSFGRNDDRGRGDLYMSTKDKTGQWQHARNLKAINSDKLDYCPFVSFDKKILFFTSERTSLSRSYPAVPATYASLVDQFNSPGNGSGDIYWVDFTKLGKE